MGLFNFLNKDDERVYDEEYWERRHLEDLEGKNIVTRYLVCFGSGHYDDFCGLKKIKGFYDKRSPYDDKKLNEENSTKNVPTFSQIDGKEKYFFYYHDIDYVFESANEAQKYYNSEIHKYTEPLYKKIENLRKSVVKTIEHLDLPIEKTTISGPAVDSHNNRKEEGTFIDYEELTFKYNADTYIVQEAVYSRPLTEIQQSSLNHMLENIPGLKEAFEKDVERVNNG